MKKVAYAISDISDYGKFILFCIANELCVYPLYFNENEKGDKCFVIDLENKKCFFSSRLHFEHNGYEIVKPIFKLDSYGQYRWCY